MRTLPLDEPAGVLIKTTCVDYPGLVAGSFFLHGCNLRCPYCYNSALVTPGTGQMNTIRDFFDLMEKRQGILKGIVISGGEPLINPYTPVIIRKAREFGYKVKLDTNGTLPGPLEALLDSEELRPDFIAMDIKTSPGRYGELLCPTQTGLQDASQDFETALKKSAALVSSLPCESREFRTVLVPPLVEKNDIDEMTRILPEDASWQFAQFQNQGCLNPSYNEINPYTDDEARKLVEYARTLIKGARLR
ncbi:MAG: anaerobic ribonucleoside-triphosphate reductase activating protein [Treponema sp.]|nr:anaerobic ribonucleoside-triphosphate reductase activating protein [Treponema sp.]